MSDKRAEQPEERENFTVQRWIVGGLSAVFLTLGIFLYVGGNPEFQALSGIFVRVGMILGAGCLAWDQLLIRPSKFSFAGIGIGIAVLVLAASRPKLFPILFAISIVAVFINGAIRRFTGKLPKRGDKR